MTPKPRKRGKRRVVIKNRSAVLRRYSPSEQQDIMDLADSLALLLPATSRGDYSLQNIAKNAGLVSISIPASVTKGSNSSTS